MGFLVIGFAGRSVAVERVKRSSGEAARGRETGRAGGGKLPRELLCAVTGGTTEGAGRGQPGPRLPTPRRSALGLVMAGSKRQRLLTPTPEAIGGYDLSAIRISVRTNSLVVQWNALDNGTNTFHGAQAIKQVEIVFAVLVAEVDCHHDQ